MQNLLFSIHSEPAVAPQPAFQLRPFQGRGYRRICDAARAGHKRILAVSPTGSGKMVLAAYLMLQAREKGNRAGFIADQPDLVGQCLATFQKFWGERDVSVISAKHGRSLYNPEHALWAIAKDTLYARALRRNRTPMPELDTLMFDEAHKSMARTWQRVGKHYEDIFQVGFTATPCRADNKGLGDYWDTMVQIATYAELLELKLIKPIRGYVARSPDASDISIDRGEFNQTQCEERFEQDNILGDVVEKYLLHGEGRCGVCFATSVKHSRYLCDEFIAHGVKAKHLDDGTPDDERRQVLDDCRDGKVEMLCNFGITTTGVDVPIWSYIAGVRMTNSFGLWRQMGGRGTRPEGAEDCILMDHAGNIGRHGLPDEDVEWTLERSDNQVERLTKPKPPKPLECPQCGSVRRGRVCTHCGWEAPKRQWESEQVEIENTHFVEYGRKKKKKVTREEKHQAWRDFVGEAIGRNRKIGYAYHRFHKKFGCNPHHSYEFMPRGKAEWNMRAKEFYRVWLERNNTE